MLLMLQVLCNALACAGASMADPLMSMVDTYFSGQLGTTALAALGSNGALFRCAQQQHLHGGGGAVGGGGGRGIPASKHAASGCIFKHCPGSRCGEQCALFCTSSNSMLLLQDTSTVHGLTMTSEALKCSLHMWLPPVPLLRALGVGCSVMYFLRFTAVCLMALPRVSPVVCQLRYLHQQRQHL
jgi:hypothetical protein